MKLSIITINYNHADGLLQTIESVIFQSYQYFEWIIIDGGSTDGSRELIVQYQEHLSYWCSEPDKGVYNAMNKGIAQAHGEYLLFLNSGDYLCDKNVLQEVVNKELDADILVGYIYREKKGKMLLDKGHNIETLSATDLLTNSLPHQATFIRKDLFDRFGMYDESYRIVSDWKFFMQTIVYGNVSVKSLEMPITVYECDGISDTNPQKIVEERKTVIEQLFPPRIWADYENLQSLSDVVRYPFFRKLYGVLYRMAALWHKHELKKLVG